MSSEESEPTRSRSCGSKKKLKKREEALSSEESEPTRSRSCGSKKKLKKREEALSSEELEPTRSRSRGSNKKLKKREEVSSSEESEPTRLRSCGSKKKLKKREEALSSEDSEPTRSRSSGSKKIVEKMLLQLMELQKDTLLRVKQLEEDKDTVTFSSQATNDLSYDGYRICRRRHRGPTSYSSYRKWVNNNGVDNSSFNWKGRMRGGGRGRGGWLNHKNFNLFKL
ncbi:zinc finger Ran-binding domain-containing protein 2 isoform X6 [Hydra vulgaris]|uniref:zinc finger Ran-binding domain-containing protein 2 isoform X6 n=1 Tax=Hydra vulgaris TaxID=6087 RepID=UPI001F5F2E4D|nr:zinc finger Ran-binding domain-containing protein 2-like isoform X5 [Hydra vulgaris]XP_047143417.1 zinc finger Ran-binding domain-containing protein 2-like isoform X5 [Hydra vulgaris]